jgi:hypothetical protein
LHLGALRSIRSFGCEMRIRSRIAGVHDDDRDATSASSERRASGRRQLDDAWQECSFDPLQRA